MSIVVTTPTGNIGRALAEALLSTNESVTLVARDAGKVASLVQRGAKLVTGSHGDPETLKQATRGASALFLLTPPDWQVRDIRAHYRRFAEAARAAVEANGVRHLVHLSSVGADVPSGNGPVAGLYEAEQLLAGLKASVTHLRPAYFMENTLGQIPAIKGMGGLFTTFRGDFRFPMIATRDIAARAAELLTRRDWSGYRTMELLGAGDVSYDDVAAVLSEVLGRPVRHTTVSPEQQRQALMGMGFSAELADSFAELAAGMSSGHVRFREPRGASNTTPTAYPVFAKQVFAPAFNAG